MTPSEEPHKRRLSEGGKERSGVGGCGEGGGGHRVAIGTETKKEAAPAVFLPRRREGVRPVTVTTAAAPATVLVEPYVSLASNASAPPLLSPPHLPLALSALRSRPGFLLVFSPKPPSQEFCGLLRLAIGPTCYWSHGRWLLRLAIGPTAAPKQLRLVYPGRKEAHRTHTHRRTDRRIRTFATFIGFLLSSL